MRDEVLFFFSSRSSIALASTTEMRKEIDDIKDLQLSSNQKRESYDISIDDDFEYKIMIHFSFNDEDSHKQFVISSRQSTQLEKRRVKLSNETDLEHFDEYVDSDLNSEILLQFEIRSISHNQLIIEVKGIYADLIMLKIKCIDVDKKHYIIVQKKSSFCLTSLSHEQ